MKTPASDVSASESKKEMPTVICVRDFAIGRVQIHSAPSVGQKLKRFLGSRQGFTRSEFASFVVKEASGQVGVVIGSIGSLKSTGTRIHPGVSQVVPRHAVAPSGNNQPPLSEAEVEFLERQIPALAGAATQKAYWEALSGGASVVCTRGRELVEVAPDGTKRVLDTLEEGSSLPVGTVLSL